MIKEGAMRISVTVLAGAAAAALILALAPEAAAQALATSRFTQNVGGWTVAGDTATVRPDHIAAGGHPGGFAQTDDQVDGGIMYWVAPAKFLGKQRTAYLGALTFDLQQSSTASQFDADDVVLTGGGITLTYNTASNPAMAPAWTHYHVPLRPRGWFNGGAPATAHDLRTVLGALTDLRIRAEYVTGPDTDGLDNVTLVPRPAPPA